MVRGIEIRQIIRILTYFHHVIAKILLWLQIIYPNSTDVHFGLNCKFNRDFRFGFIFTQKCSTFNTFVYFSVSSRCFGRNSIWSFGFDGNRLSKFVEKVLKFWNVPWNYGNILFEYSSMVWEKSLYGKRASDKWNCCQLRG